MMKLRITLTLVTLTTFLTSSCSTNVSDNSKQSEQTNLSTSQSAEHSPEVEPMQQPEAQKEIVKEWVKIKSWKGTGIKKTETFDADGDWRIIWNYSADDDGNALAISYYRDGNDALEGLAANEGGQLKGCDTSYVNSAGKFYLDINAANCSWKVMVEAEQIISE